MSTIGEPEWREYESFLYCSGNFSVNSKLFHKNHLGTRIRSVGKYNYDLVSRYVVFDTKPPNLLEKVCYVITHTNIRTLKTKHIYMSTLRESNLKRNYLFNADPHSICINLGTVKDCKIPREGL